MIRKIKLFLIVGTICLLAAAMPRSNAQAAENVFDKETWVFSHFTCQHYNVALMSPLSTQGARHFLHALWAYVGGLEGRPWIVNPLYGQEGQNLLTQLNFNCRSSKLQTWSVVDIVRYQKARMLPYFEPSEETKQASATGSMDSWLMYFNEFKCWRLVDGMKDGQPTPDLLRQLDIMWAFYVGEQALDTINIYAARDASTKLIEYCIAGEDPDQSVIELMRRHRTELMSLVR